MFAGLVLLLFTQGQSLIATLGFAAASVAIIVHVKARRRCIDTYTFLAASQTILRSQQQRIYQFADVVGVEFDRDWLDIGLGPDLHTAYWLILRVHTGEKLCIAHGYRWKLNELLAELASLGLQTHNQKPAACPTMGRLIVLPRATARPRK